MAIGYGITPDVLVKVGGVTAGKNSGISSIKVVSKMGSADSATIEIDNIKDASGTRNLSKIYKSDSVEIQLGYTDKGKEIVFYGTVDKRKPSLTKTSGALLNIECVGEEFTLLTSQIGKEVSFTNSSLVSIVSGLLTKAGSTLTLNIINPKSESIGSPVENPVITFDEEMSYMECFKQLAKDKNYDIVTLASSTMTWYPKDEAKGKAILIKYGDNLIAGEVEDSEAFINAVTVKAGKVNEETTLVHTEKDLISLALGVPERGIIIYAPELDTLAAVQERAKSELKTHEGDKVTGNVTVVGSPDYKKRGLVQIEDDGAIGLKGIFQIEEVTHNLTKSEGYICQLKLKQGEVVESG